MAITGKVQHKIVGTGSFTYETVVSWEKLPDDWSFVETVGMATDSRDRVYVFNRSEQPVIVLDREGNFLHAWGKDRFVRPHGIWIGPDDMLYLADDEDHTLGKYTPDGQLVMKLGTSGQGSDTGIKDKDYRTIKGGPPFNKPTNLALDPAGNMYITDGYGNCKVHKFSPDGQHLLSWGEPGTGPGQFNIPHGIGIDSRQRLYICDRENSRIQIFDTEGNLLDLWTHVVRPCEAFIDSHDNVFVAELGTRVGLLPWMNFPATSPGGRVSIFDTTGNLQSRWGGGDEPGTPGDFLAPHDIWVDSQGSIYVGEVIVSSTGNKQPVGCPSLQKFSLVKK